MNMPFDLASLDAAPAETVSAGGIGLSREEFALLAQIGLASAARGLGERARPVFDALALLAPQHAAASICRALSAIGRGAHDAAIAELRQHGTRARHGRREAKALLLLALCLARRRAEALPLYHELAGGPEGPARRLARSLAPMLCAGRSMPGAGIPPAHTLR